jgi:hypothetical protein
LYFKLQPPPRCATVHVQSTAIMWHWSTFRKTLSPLPLNEIPSPQLNSQMCLEPSCTSLQADFCLSPFRPLAQSRKKENAPMSQLSRLCAFVCALLFPWMPGPPSQIQTLATHLKWNSSGRKSFLLLSLVCIYALATWVQTLLVLSWGFLCIKSLACSRDLKLSNIKQIVSVRANHRSTVTRKYIPLAFEDFNI